MLLFQDHCVLEFDTLKLDLHDRKKLWSYLHYLNYWESCQYPVLGLLDLLAGALMFILL